MRHTQLNVRNYSSLAVVVLLVSSVSVGFGTVDLAMIAHKGVGHVAAVGEGDLIIAGLIGFFSGFVDTFSSRLAMAEGQGETGRRLPVLAGALLLMVAVCEVVAVAASFAVTPLLHAAHQNADLVPGVHDYVAVRLYSVPLLIGYVALNEALKILGLKNSVIRIMVFGFCINAAADWLFLYSDLSSLFPSPEAAVATATSAAQTLMACASTVVFVRQMRRRDRHFARPEPGTTMPEFWSMARTAPGIGVRHLNDYMGAIVPMMFVAPLGVQALAAFGLAVKIYTLFCRIPQACVSATFVYYAYEVGREQSPSRLRASASRLVTYCAVPTAAGAVVVMVSSPWLVKAFGGASIDTGTAVAMLFAFMATIPLYVFEASYGEMLTVHQRGGMLSVSSTLTTWLIMIPAVVIGVTVWSSAAWSIAAGGVLATAVQAWIFHRTLRVGHWSTVPAETASVGAQVA